MNRDFDIEHFGFTAEQLSLERKHYLEKIIRNVLDAMVNKFKASGKTSELLLNAKEEVFKNMWMSISNENECLCDLDKKYFTIPDNVLLPPYFGHVKSYSDKDEQELDKRLEILKKSFLENSTMIALLKTENSQYKTFSSFIDNEVKIQQQLKDSLNSVDTETLVKLDGKTNNLLKNL